MPRTQDLPADISSLSRRNALEISDSDFHQGVNRLIEAINKKVALTQSSPGSMPIQNQANRRSASGEERKSSQAEANVQLLVTNEASSDQLAFLRRMLLIYKPNTARDSVFLTTLFRVLFWMVSFWTLLSTIVFLSPAGSSIANGEMILATIVYLVTAVGFRKAALWSEKRGARSALLSDKQQRD